MAVTLEKRTTDYAIEFAGCLDLRDIKEELGRQNRIEADYIGFFPQSDQALNIFIASFVNPGDETLTVGPTAENICEAIASCDASYIEFHERPVFLPDSLGIISRITERTKLIILGNPNRYTGVVYSEKEIEDIIGNSADTILILDESVFESSRITAIDLVKKYDNLALLRSFNSNKNCRIEYIIADPAIANKADKARFVVDCHNSDLSGILNGLKSQGDRLKRFKSARQEMLYLSIRLRMFGLSCFLNPDYSLIIGTTDSEKLLSLLNGIGIRGQDLGRFPGLSGNVMLPFSLNIKAMPIICVFENMSSDKKFVKPKGHRLTIYRPSESDAKFRVERNQDTVSGNRLESNMVF
ncbi:MAG: hypothetical protein DRP51_02485 [Candidatus Zixiibacteriota bacterium]|nr:MAG: hypothetical protein DRP51_02485 [candidate division Zixibacteria bacterium]